ncbi:MAG: radical SAM protein, partial [Patescibacteria group bacterium]
MDVIPYQLYVKPIDISNITFSKKKANNLIFMLIGGIQEFTTLDFPGRLATVVFTAGCNFRCGYCHNPQFVDEEQVKNIKTKNIPEDIFFKFLEKRKGKLEGVCIGGGEPTIQADI